MRRTQSKPHTLQVLCSTGSKNSQSSSSVEYLRIPSELWHYLFHTLLKLLAHTHTHTHATCPPPGASGSCHHCCVIYIISSLKSNLCLELRGSAVAASTCRLHSVYWGTRSSSGELLKTLRTENLLIHFQAIPLLICMLLQRVKISHAALISPGTLPPSPPSCQGIWLISVLGVITLI